MVLLRILNRMYTKLLFLGLHHLVAGFLTARFAFAVNVIAVCVKDVTLTNCEKVNDNRCSRGFFQN